MKLASKKFLIVEDDGDIQSLLSQHLKDLDVRALAQAKAGDEAWNLLKKHKFDFILLDWKLPGLGGLTLLNRLRTHAYYRQVPVLVVSGFLSLKDDALIGDYPLTQKLEKPFSQNLLDQKISKLLKEGEWFNKYRVKLHEFLSTHDITKENNFNKISSKILQSKNIVRIVSMLSDDLIKADKIGPAIELIKGIIEKIPSNPILLNKLGHLYLIEGDLDKAYKVLTQATKISPLNFDRLVNIGLLEMEMGDLFRSDANFNRALRCDPDGEGALLGLKHNKILRGDKTLQTAAYYAGVHNQLGINCTRNNDMILGAEHYRMALAQIVDPLKRARVQFNIGLCYLREHEIPLAINYLVASLATDPHFQKARKKLQSMGLSPLDINKRIAAHKGLSAVSSSQKATGPKPLRDSVGRRDISSAYAKDIRRILDGDPLDFDTSGEKDRTDYQDDSTRSKRSRRRQQRGSISLYPDEPNGLRVHDPEGEDDSEDTRPSRRRRSRRRAGHESQDYDFQDDGGEIYDEDDEHDEADGKPRRKRRHPKRAKARSIDYRDSKDKLPSRGDESNDDSSPSTKRKRRSRKVDNRMLDYSDPNHDDKGEGRGEDEDDLKRRKRRRRSKVSQDLSIDYKVPSKVSRAQGEQINYSSSRNEEDQQRTMQLFERSYLEAKYPIIKSLIRNLLQKSVPIKKQLSIFSVLIFKFGEDRFHKEVKEAVSRQIKDLDAFTNLFQEQD